MVTSNGCRLIFGQAGALASRKDVGVGVGMRVGVGMGFCLCVGVEGGCVGKR